MGFSDRQVRALRRRVPASRIKTRLSEGKEFSYIEGWFVLEQANRIFGFDGWDRETIEASCIHAREERGVSTALYQARVRVTVRTESGAVVRDGHGTGEARASSLGEAHDRALKAAETDATKRALVTFGRAFGLALYATRATAPGARPAQAIPANVASNALPSASPSPAEPIAEAARAGASTVSPAKSAPAVHPDRVALIRGSIDKSALALPEPRRLRDKEHLRYVASQPCVVCSTRPADAHHLRFAQPRAMGRKVSDEFTVPLCRNHHRELHNEGNEMAWWHDIGIDPLAIARELWVESSALGGRTTAPAAGGVEEPVSTSAAGLLTEAGPRVSSAVRNALRQ